MKRITLLFLTTFFCATLLLGQPGKALITKDPGHRIHLVLNEEETEKIPVLNFYRDLQEGFEGYSDFETDLSPWFNVDVDGADTYGITDHTFPNNGEPMSFIVFNPDEVSPPMTDDPAIQPHTGEKFAACFSSIPPPYNDDWLITPPLDLGTNSELSFWVKSYTDSYGLERYNVGVSTTGTNPEDFIIISGPTPMLAPADNWEEQTYDLGDYNGQTVYVGIQCVSEDAFIFMVDDVSVTWDDVALEAPENLYAELNQLSGQVQLSWDFSGGGSGEWIQVTGNWTDLQGETKSVSTTDKKWSSAYYDMEIADYEFEVTCEESNEEQSQVGIMFSGSPEPLTSEGYWDDGYMVTVSTNTGSGMYSIGVQADQEFTYLLDWTADEDVNTGYGAWNTVKVVRTGAFMEVFINDVSKGSWFDNTHPTGYLGLAMSAPDFGGQARFKDISITPINKNLRDFQHFKVYRNNMEIATTTDKNYIDNLPEFGTFEYEVSAYFDEGESEKDGPVSVTWEQGSGSATLTGMVTDATNDEPVANAMVSVAGLTDMTDEMGNYLIEDIPAGVLKANFSATPNTGDAPLSVEFSDLSTENTHTVSCTAGGYIPYENQQVVIPDGGNVELDIPMSPEISAGQMRMVLSWGSFPEDLDAHLLTPEIGGQAYEIFYDNKGSLTEPPYAFLDNDDVNGFGPETITIADFFPGTYKYFIFNYDEDTSVTVSNAAVKIYDDTGLKYDLEVPATGDGFYWYVCDINGSTKQVTIKNQILDAPPGNARSLFAPPKKKSENPYYQRDIVSWNWDFGDGSNSTDQNPTHVYQNDGTYDVSLTVSDGTSQNTAIKQNYIVVGELGIDDHLYDDAVVYPNPADGFLKIHSEKMIRTLILTDSKGRLVFRKDISSKEYVLSTESMAPGLYLLRFEGESGSGSRKILVR